jgi:hypothetical protein
MNYLSKPENYVLGLVLSEDIKISAECQAGTMKQIKVCGKITEDQYR